MRLVMTLVMVTATAALDADELRNIGHLDHAPLDEVSGIVSSAEPDVYWVQNDSGDEARLFAVRGNGEIVMPEYLAPRYRDTPWPGLKVLNAWNVDWEDLARDPEGTLYIPDLGNNGNARRDLGVYVLPEPDPRSVPESRALTFLPVRYPDQHQFPAEHWHFDCEAVFYADGRLYFLTKHRRPGEITGWESGTRLYRLDSHFTDRENVLTLVGTRDDVFLATAADLSPDGRHVAVLTYLGVWLFARPADGDNWLRGASRFVALPREQLKTAEAITWTGPDTLLIANEERDLLSLVLSALP
jgi:hypothetical protein